MSDKETLHFKLELAGTYWDNRPAYSVLVNDQVVASGVADAPSGELFVVEFDAEVAEGDAILSIRLENKEWQDTVQNEDKTEILKDMLLNIRRVEIDEIDLGNMIHTKSTYTPDDSTFPTLDHCIDLGWNGTWSIKFTSPFYIWLLENL
jgi:hypothetical protein